MSHAFKCLLLLSSLCVVHAHLQAQPAKEAAKSEIPRQSADTAKVGDLLAMHESLKYEHPAKSLDPLKEALALSEHLKFDKGKVRALLAAGDYLYNSSKYDSALSLFMEAQNHAEKIPDRSLIVASLCKQGNVLNDLRRLSVSDSLIKLGLLIALEEPLDSAMVALSYNTLGNNAFTNNRFDQALEYYQNTLRYSVGNIPRQAAIYQNMGLISLNQGNFDAAEDYFLEALTLAREIDETRIIAKTYGFLGMVKRGQKEYDQARNYYTLAMEHYERVTDLSNMAHVYNNLSNLHKDLGEYGQAIEEMEKCLKLLNQVNFPLAVCYTLNNLGELYLKIGAYRKAESYVKQAKEKSLDAGVLIVNVDASRLLSQLYDSLGDYENAYRFHVEYAMLKDSLDNQTNQSRMAELEEKYQNEKKQQEIELLSAENQITVLELQKQQNLRNYLIVAAILLVLLIGVMYNRYQINLRSKRRLEDLDKLKSNFFTNISHEFRTPLSLIISPVQKLLQKESNESSRKELAVVHRNASRLTQLIDQIMDLSKLEAGELQLQVAQNNLKEQLKVAAASFESLAESEAIDFQVNIHEAPELAFYDTDKVLTILNNLLSNAFKFTPPGGNIELNCQMKQRQVHISVADTGPGISEADQQVIFHRYQQGSVSHPSTSGTGIGLTLSRELALLHQGDIHVKSTIGMGTTFTVHFPVNRESYPSSEGKMPQNLPKLNIDNSFVASDLNTASPLEHQQIVLIVEDNLDLRQHMQSLLSDRFTVELAEHGEAGLKIAQELVPDVIISDLMMPVMDGVELCQAIKANDKTSHIPVILLTAKADKQTKLSGLQTGADDFLTKPFDNDELMVRVQNLIEQRRKLHEKFSRKLSLSPTKIESESPNDRFIRKALETVEQQLSNADFTVEQFQEEMAMSRMQLHRKLKALTDFSASEFVRDIRLQRAAELLTQEGINVTEVAYSCGFNSTSYFAQCFKEKYGTSPSKYLQKMP